MCRGKKKKENIYFSYMSEIPTSHSQRENRGAIRCRTAWQDIRQRVSERADLAVVTATVKGGKTRSLPSRS